MTRTPAISLPPAVIRHPEPPPRLDDWGGACRDFSWAQARGRLSGLPGGGLNMAWEAVDRHVVEGRGHRPALRHLGADGRVTELTFEQLQREIRRLSAGLRRLGLRPGDRFFTLTGRQLEFYAGSLAALRAGGVLCPLFSAFGPEPIRERLQRGRGRFLLTTAGLYRRKIEPLRAALPDLEAVVIVGDEQEAFPGTLPFSQLRVDDGDDAPAATTDESPALLHFTSGTTGPPKGALHLHEAMVVQHETATTALDLRPGDLYWCTADPGWVTGTVYGLVAPLAAGATLLVDEAEFDGRRWLRLLAEERVTVWYTAPTAIRLLRRIPAEELRELRFPELRLAASVGEPLDAGSVLWGSEVLGIPFHDTWWQTETGAIMIANLRSAPIKPGSMGRPMPGIEVGIVRREKQGIRSVSEIGAIGELALRTPWPSMFRDYVGDEKRYARCFADGWYLTGDLVSRDGDGYLWFQGRADDLIQSAGHRIGPTEVERTLLAHPAVLEAGVIGIPDPVSGERVKAFVSLRHGFEPSEVLRRELLAHARRRLGGAVAPKEIEFRIGLPKTRSGKILRRLLRARELGEPAGDLSTMLDEEAATDPNAHPVEETPTP